MQKIPLEKSPKELKAKKNAKGSEVIIEIRAKEHILQNFEKISAHNLSDK